VGTISLGKNNTLEAIKLGNNITNFINLVEKKDLRGNQNTAIDYIENAGLLINKQIHKNFYHDGFIVIGPPGTGKTFVICIGSLLYLNRKDQLRNKRSRWNQVAIATFTNAAADRIILQFENIFKAAKVPQSIRYGLVRRILSQEDNINQSIKDYSNTLYKPPPTSRTDWLDLWNHCDAARIFVGTIYAIRRAIKGLRTENIIKKIKPSLILFDEASQINISQFNMTVYAGDKNFNSVGLIGDISQLPPIKRIVDLKQDALSYLSGSQGGVIKITRKTQLNVQSRMHKIIRGLSQVIGEYIIPISDYYLTQSNDLGKFIPPPTKFSQDIKELLDINNRIVILDNSKHPESEEIPIGTSKINRMEASAAKLIAKFFKQCYPELKKSEIMIIVPYKKQTAEIQDPDNYRTGTVDSFQGQEARLVIATTVRTNPDVSLDFVSDLRRINVMVSRAKSKLIILNNKEAFDGNKIFDKVFDYVLKNPNEAKILNYDPNLEKEIKNLI